MNDSERKVCKMVRKGRVVWMGNPDIRAKINQRRRQILVHSIIYYIFNDSIVSDKKWSEWALELETLQKQYPDISETCVYAEAFQNFDHSTGCNLPLDDVWGNQKAAYLLRIRGGGV
jgi:hypothetical protein